MFNFGSSATIPQNTGQQAQPAFSGFGQQQVQQGFGQQTPMQLQQTFLNQQKVVNIQKDFSNPQDTRFKVFFL